MTGAQEFPRRRLSAATRGAVAVGDIVNKGLK
jgi:hypothetical protein